MVSRASHYSAKARHSQREFGQEKPKLAKRDEGNAWLTEAVAALQGLKVGEYWNLKDISSVAPFNRDQLRELSRRGVLHMRGHRTPGGVFIEFQWALTASGDLS